MWRTSFALLVALVVVVWKWWWLARDVVVREGEGEESTIRGGGGVAVRRKEEEKKQTGPDRILVTKVGRGRVVRVGARVGVRIPHGTDIDIVRTGRRDKDVDRDQ